MVKHTPEQISRMTLDELSAEFDRLDAEEAANPDYEGIEASLPLAPPWTDDPDQVTAILIPSAASPLTPITPGYPTPEAEAEAEDQYPRNPADRHRT